MVFLQPEEYAALDPTNEKNSLSDLVKNPKLGGSRGGKPQVFVLCGPSGVGKGTVVQELRKRYADRFFLSVSATTRPARPGEVNGEHYLFISTPQFERMINDGQMLEWARVHQLNYYGTPRGPVVEALAQGKPALLEIDLDGARQVRKSMPDACFVFLAPPSFEHLRQRLSGRATETLEEQEIRIRTARVEMAAQGEFDRIIINDELSVAVDELAQIMGLA